MKTLIVCILCLIVHNGASEDLPVSNNDVSVSFFAQQACAHGEILKCSDDCKGRKFCMYGQEQTIDCYVQTAKTYCNSKTLECTPVANECGAEEQPDIKCPGVGYYPHTLNCSQLVNCGSTSVKVLDCGSLIFDPVNKQCKAGVPCYSFSSVNGLCKGKVGQILVHPLNKAIFVLCSEKYPQIGECPPNHIFNTIKLKCEYQCTTIGRIADPMDRACYYSCTKSSTTYISEHICCASKEIFNPDILACSPINL